MNKSCTYLIAAFLSAAAVAPSTYAVSTLSLCANRTNGNLRVVNSSSDCHQNEDFMTLNTGSSAKPSAQNTWFSTTGAGGTGWITVPGSTFTATTNGGPLLIFLDLSVGMNVGTVTCRAVIDGVWAGTYGGLPASPTDPNWTEGVLSSNSVLIAWNKWSKTRLYPGVPAGTHTFSVQCAAFGNVSICSSGDGSIGCSAGFVEQ